MSVHTISVLVENHPGALSRIANLFSSRGYNISSLAVAETEDPSVSRMTILVAGDESVLEQVVKQLNKLVAVIKVLDLGGEPMLSRELLFVRVDASKNNRHEIASLAAIVGARVAAVSPNSMTLELTSEPIAIDDFIGLIKPYGIKELVRSGTIAIKK
jgi:acetolactate synthase-1/3 small subunit